MELRLFSPCTKKNNCSRNSQNFYTLAKWSFRGCILFSACPEFRHSVNIWAASWQNQQNGMCTQQRLRSAWASVQSDQSLCCLHEENWKLGPKLPIKRRAKTDQTWQMPRLIGAHAILLVLSWGAHWSFLLYNFKAVVQFCSNLHHTLNSRQCMFDRKIGAEESVLQELCLFVILTIRCWYYDW